MSKQVQTTTESTESTATAKISAALKTSIAAYVSNEQAVIAASTAREKTGVKLGLLVRESFPNRAAADANLRDFFTEAFEATGRPALYASSQFSRILSFAFPGGKDANKAQAKAALAQQEKGLAANLPWNDLIPLSNGKAKLVLQDKEVKEDDGSVTTIQKPTVIKVVTGGSGGSNAKPPLQQFVFSLDNALTAAKTAQIDLEVIATKTAEALIALGYTAEDIATAFEAATQE